MFPLAFSFNIPYTYAEMEFESVSGATSHASSRAPSSGDLDALLGPELIDGAPPRARSGSVAAPDSVEAAKNRMANMSLGGGGARAEALLENYKGDLADVHDAVAEIRVEAAQVVVMFEDPHTATSLNAALRSVEGPPITIKITLLKFIYDIFKKLTTKFTEDGELAPAGEKVQMGGGGA